MSSFSRKEAFFGLGELLCAPRPSDAVEIELHDVDDEKARADFARAMKDRPGGKLWRYPSGVITYEIDE